MDSKKHKCLNCGREGHTQKKCTSIRSLGIIAVRKDLGRDFEFLLIQRRHSIGYCEFIKGCYLENDVDFILRLFTDMTEVERENILSKSFEDLWDSIWCSHCCRYYRRDFESARKSFEHWTHEELVDFVSRTQTKREEPEWGFPKGHRKWFEESDLDAAIREFNEETNYTARDYIILNDVPYEESFIGLNQKKYSYLYFTAVLITSRMSYIDIKNYNQVGEVGDIGWFRIDEAIKKINPLLYPKRVEILRKFWASLQTDNIEKEEEELIEGINEICIA